MNFGCFYNGKIYAYGNLKNEIIEYDLSSETVTKKYTLPIEEIKPYGVRAYNGKLYIIYTDKNEKSNILNMIEINLSAFKNVNNVVINTHKTYSHTKDEISQKYKAAIPKAQYKSIDDLFTTKPVTTAPYKEGVLKEQVKQDTLNQLNYYRWLYGINNNVTINESRMYKNARGALAMFLNNELTHYPTKPNGMTDEFYKDAQEGTGAGSNYSGDIAYGLFMPYTIAGYINDTYNMSPNVGHRTSMLDLKGNQISFGQCRFI